MVESSKNVAVLFPFPGIPSRLGIAVFVKFIGYKYQVMALMKCLSKGSAKYAQDNEHMLDQFWIIGKPVRFSKDYLGVQPTP